jgi:hypothetical protein
MLPNGRLDLVLGNNPSFTPGPIPPYPYSLRRRFAGP